ncbi:type II CRISPR RNA-guided endonuclease Cas9 [Methylibium sp.]|uniref:type II CRISPR RNA-guided endonuclease Cas9 n=1 Tax=Methylibium sp. TaxID=2067992 RepID=UPI003D0DFFEB
MLRRMRYRLALDIGTTSIGWCLIRLDKESSPCAVIRMGSRIFSDGRSPKDGSSLAVTRRLARQMRRRRDRLLKRKARLQNALVRLGFWPQDIKERKAFESLNPYALRREGLDKPLTPAQFGRALFHLNQRRGFLSNRKTDKKDNESGLLKSAIRKLRDELSTKDARTVGEWLADRHGRRESVRARLRGKTVKDRAYDLYIDRAMVAEEFDRLWAAQAQFQPEFFTSGKRDELRDILLHQRPLRPVRPGRCTLIPTEERAPLALPSTQRFRIYQELNNLRLLTPQLQEQVLTLDQRDTLAALLESGDVTFTKMRRALKLPGSTKFNLEDVKRDRLTGNATTRNLASEDCFGDRWRQLRPELQDEIVSRLLDEASESALVTWLVEGVEMDEAAAERIASINLPEGYGNLSRAALERVLPELQREVITYAEAVKRAGFDSHSALSRAEQTGEVLDALPYYGEALQRHVGFADPRATAEDLPEKRFGRIANPTVHIGLNELRKVVNTLIKRYGHPSEVIVEVARELKQGEKQRKLENERQAERQKQNEHFRETIRTLPGLSGREPTRDDLQRMRLWVELNPQDAANRCCPYTGEHIGMAMLFSGEVEIEHILPFSMTLDDSLNNKTVALRRANRDKGNRTPHDAFGSSPTGYDYSAILQRAAWMSKDKAKRFAPDGYQRWLRDDQDFLARALTDTAYLSRIAKEYLSLICPPNRVRVIPGRMTAMLRGLFGLSKLLSPTGEKNRDDHRHHAIDAAVIGVTDQGMLQRFAKASADAREMQLHRLVADMPDPWPSYREHVARAVRGVIVSHKPDHGHEGALHNDTAYGFRGDGEVVHRVMVDSFKSADEITKKDFADEQGRQWLLEQTAGLSGKEFGARIESLTAEGGPRRVRVVEKLSVIGMRSERAADRHGRGDDGAPLHYKGYKGDSNYCIEIWRNEKGKWESTVISTFEAHRIVREHDLQRLRHSTLAQNGRPLVMRLMLDDLVRLTIDGGIRTMRVATLSANGQVFMADHNEANVDARNRDKSSGFKYVSKYAGSLQSAKARRVTVSEIGDLRDPSFKP